jgi:hypothetical protein
MRIQESGRWDGVGDCEDNDLKNMQTVVVHEVRDEAWKVFRLGYLVLGDHQTVQSNSQVVYPMHPN